MKICSKCRIKKDDSMFSKHTKSRDGLNSWCKDCHKQYTIDKKSRTVIPESKTCSRCEKLLDSRMFHKCPTRNDGLSNTCKSCVSEYAKHHPRNFQVIQDDSYSKKCKACGIILPKTEFRICKISKDGLRGFCIKCEKDRERNQPKILVDSKTCTKCGKTLPTEMFFKSSRSKDNHRPSCKECDSIGSAIRSRTWRNKNPIKSRAIWHKRKSRMISNGGEFTSDEWKELCDRYDNRCLKCGRNDVKLTIDHIIPVSMGGSNDISNIQPLCTKCNCSKRQQSIDYR